MALNVAIQMDPMEHIDIHADSTFVLALEAQARGHTLFHYLPQDMSLNGNRLSALAHPLQVQRQEGGRHFTFGAPETVDLGDFDIILMRQDPPFDMAYITATHLLEHVSDRTLVLNDPQEVRNAPEKLFVTHFSDLMPPTLISASHTDILKFREEHKDIILKPLYGNGGAQVFHVPPENDNMNALLEMFAGLYREPIMVQKYLPEIAEGDKRIILIDGRAAGAVSRIPAKGEARANFHVGGLAQKTELTKRDKEICERIGPSLSDRGLVFAGIDIIGDYITEINVTSPTGLQEINTLDNTRLEAEMWDTFEERLSQFKRQKVHALS